MNLADKSICEVSPNPELDHIIFLVYVMGSGNYCKTDCVYLAARSVFGVARYDAVFTRTLGGRILGG